MSSENRRESIFSLRNLVQGYGHRSTALSQWINFKRYLIVGMFLAGLYVFQYLSGLQWSGLLIVQSDMAYKQLSGYLLLIALLYQWRLSKERNFNRLARRPRVLKNHKWVGAFLPLPLFFHAIQPGYGYQYVLTASFLLCIVVGLFNTETVRVQCKTCLFIWTLLHIILAVMTLILVVFHIYVVYAYS